MGYYTATRNAWLGLMAASLATTALSLVPSTGPAIGAAILALAYIKARIILRRYLGLQASRFWRAGFDAVIIGFLLIAFALYLAPWMRAPV